MEQQKKENEYALKIVAKIQELFDEDAEGDSIDKDEFLDGDNTIHFIHALSNIAPLLIYQKLTGDKNVDLLSFNHLANQLVFQYVKQVKS